MAIVPRVDGPTWDPEKARQNLAKHGVSFEEAYRVLIHSLTRHWPDGTHSPAEERTISIGLTPTGGLFTIVTAVGIDGTMRNHLRTARHEARTTCVRRTLIVQA